MAETARHRILLIDDDEIDRELVIRAIGSCFSVTTAIDGASGLQSFRADKPECVLLDLRLPDMDGTQLLSEFKDEGIPVVMMTGFGNETVAVESMKRGAQDYICKGAITSELLQQVIRKAIHNADMQRKLNSQRAELESFVSVASHDLRAPLRHIVRYADLARIECQGKIGSDVDRYLDRIVESGTRMTNLLNALVEFARSGRSETELEVVDLNCVLEHARSNVCDVIEESGATLNIGQLPVVLGHDESLVELFENILGNAIKYAGDSNPTIEIDSSYDGQHWTIAIRDNGIGISSQYYKEIFKPFRRLHSYSQIEGSGIGLATCKRIMDHHQGRIWVESEPDVGSTFLLTLQPVESISPNSDESLPIACVGMLSGACSSCGPLLPFAGNDSV